MLNENAMQTAGSSSSRPLSSPPHPEHISASDPNPPAMQTDDDHIHAASDEPVSETSFAVQQHPILSIRTRHKMPLSDSQPTVALRKEDTLVIEVPSLDPPTPEELAAQNIRVRDFAYESMLPPIPSIPRFRLAMPFVYNGQPSGSGPRPLKRVKRDHNPDEDPFVLTTSASNPSQEGGGRRSKPLERKSTEPVLQQEEHSPSPPRGGPLRMEGFADLAYYSPPPRFTARPTASPRRLMSIATASMPESQASQGPDTPLVTPSGSLVWPAPVMDTSAVPASQLDSESQLPSQDDVAYSHLGFYPPLPDSQAFSQSQSQEAFSSPAHPTAGPSSPKRTAPARSPCDAKLSNGTHALANPGSALSPAAANGGTPSDPDPDPASSTPPPPYSNAPATPPSTSPAPRYFLRKRTSPAPAPAASASAAPRRKPAKPPSRLVAVTRQSAHSRSPKAPVPRPLKKNVA